MFVGKGDEQNKGNQRREQGCIAYVLVYGKTDADSCGEPGFPRHDVGMSGRSSLAMVAHADKHHQKFCGSHLGAHGQKEYADQEIVVAYSPADEEAGCDEQAQAEDGLVPVVRLFQSEAMKVKRNGKSDEARYPRECSFHSVGIFSRLR